VNRGIGDVEEDAIEICDVEGDVGVVSMGDEKSLN
jgi:hypothetical protein